MVVKSIDWDIPGQVFFCHVGGPPLKQHPRLPADGVDALKNEITLEDLRGTSGSALRIIVDSTPPADIFGLALSDPKHFEGNLAQNLRHLKAG